MQGTVRGIVTQLESYAIDSINRSAPSSVPRAPAWTQAEREWILENASEEHYFRLATDEGRAVALNEQKRKTLDDLLAPGGPVEIALEEGSTQYRGYSLQQRVDSLEYALRVLFDRVSGRHRDLILADSHRLRSIIFNACDSLERLSDDSQKEFLSSEYWSSLTKLTIDRCNSEGTSKRTIPNN